MIDHLSLITERVPGYSLEELERFWDEARKVMDDFYDRGGMLFVWDSDGVSKKLIAGRGWDDCGGIGEGEL